MAVVKAVISVWKDKTEIWFLALLSPKAFMRSKFKKIPSFNVVLKEDLSERYGYLSVSFDDTDFRPTEPKILLGYPRKGGGQGQEMLSLSGGKTLEKGG